MNCSNVWVFVEIFAMLNQELVTWAVDRYNESEDHAHGMEHILTVAHEARGIAKAYNLDLEPMLLAALLHDVFSSTDRKRHHVLASDWCTNNLTDYGYSVDMAKLVARMCLEHRASGKGPYTDIYCEAFSAADRGELTIEKFVGRMLKWPEDRPNPARLKEVIDHTKEKHSLGSGYARPNNVHAKYYATVLAQFYRDVETLNMERLLEIMGE